MASTMWQRWARLLRHRWLDERDAHKAFPPEMLARLTRAVAAGEQAHTGEVRLGVEASLPTSYVWRDATPRDRALAMFSKLRVWDTEHNNGVLIYLLIADRAIEIVADRGLHQRVSSEVWRGTVTELSQALRAGRFEDGLSEALKTVNALLIQHFPLRSGEANPDELPNAPFMP